MAISTGTAILAGTVGGALIGGIGADRQADAAKDASSASLAEQRRQFDAMMERSQPFHEGSLQAYNSLLAMEGLGGGMAQQPSIANIPRPSGGRSMGAINDRSPPSGGTRNNPRSPASGSRHYDAPTRHDPGIKSLSGYRLGGVSDSWLPLDFMSAYTKQA